MIDQRQTTAVSSASSEANVRRPPGVRQKLVPVKLALLQDLQRRQEVLAAHVRLYIASDNHVGVCDDLREKVSKAKRCTDDELDDRWSDIDDVLNNLDELSGSREAKLMTDDLSTLMQLFDEEYNKVLALMASVRNPAQEGGVQRDTILDGLWRSVSSMRMSVSKIADTCEKQADSDIGTLETLLGRIFEPFADEDDLATATVEQRTDSEHRVAALTVEMQGGAGAAESAATRPDAAVNETLRGNGGDES